MTDSNREITGAQEGANLQPEGAMDAASLEARYPVWQQTLPSVLGIAGGIEVIREWRDAHLEKGADYTRLKGRCVWTSAAFERIQLAAGQPDGLLLEKARGGGSTGEGGQKFAVLTAFKTTHKNRGWLLAHVKGKPPRTRDELLQVKVRDYTAFRPGQDVPAVWPADPVHPNEKQWRHCREMPNSRMTNDEKGAGGTA